MGEPAWADVRRYATLLQPRLQPENGEFETQGALSCTLGSSRGGFGFANVQHVMRWRAVEDSNEGGQQSL
jgi:hypothetical protein